MNVTVDLLPYAAPGLPAGAALVLNARARADRQQLDRVGPATPGSDQIKAWSVADDQLAGGSRPLARRVPPSLGR